MPEEFPGETLPYRLPVTICSLFSAGTGCLALLGWILRKPHLASLGPGYIPMAPSTAVLFILFGIALFLRLKPLSRRVAHRAGMVLNAVCALVALSLLLLSFLGIQTAVERLGFPAGPAVDGAPVGHMSPVTALCFLLAGLSYFALPVSTGTRPGRAGPASVLAFLLTAAASVLLLAYLLGKPLFYSGSFIPPAATTSFAFLAMGIALLCLAAPHAWFMPRWPEPVTRGEYALILVFVSLAAGIVTVGYLYFRNYETNYRVQAEHQLTSIAGLKTSELMQFRRERLWDAGNLFGNSLLSDAVRRFLERPKDSEAQRQLQERIGRYQTYGPYDLVSFLDVRGVRRLSSPGMTNPVSSVILLRASEALRSGQVTFQDFYRDEHGKDIHLAVLVPIFDERGGGRPLGVFVLRIDPENNLYPFINRWPTASGSAETLLVRRDGNDALFLNELKFRKGPVLTVRIPLDVKEKVPAVQAVLGYEGIVEGVDYRGVPVLAYVRSVPASPWFLVARMDLSEVYAPARERLWLTVSLICVLLLAAGAGVALVWRRNRARLYREKFEAERERAWLQDVISRSLDEIYVIDPATLRFRFVNSGALRNIGYGMEEMASMTPADIKPEHTRESFLRLVRTLAAGEREVIVSETVHRRKDGSEYPVEVHLQRVEAAGGPVFLAIVNDITERRRAEERIRRGARLEAALHRIDTQILEGANIRVAMRTACDAIVEMGYLMCWIGQPDRYRVIHPVARGGFAEGYLDPAGMRGDDSSEIEEPTGIAFRTGRTFVVQSIRESSLSGPWREKAIRRGILSAAAFPLKSGEGEVVGVLTVYGGCDEAFGDEETQRLVMFAQQCSIAVMSARRMETLHDANQRLAFHVSRMPLAYVVWDKGFRVVEWNPAAERIFGWKAAEAVGKRGFELIIPAEARPHVERVWSRLLEGDDPSYSLNANVRKDGKVITCEWFNALLRDASGNVSGVLSMAHDVTEKTELERQLQTAQRMEAVGTLAGGIAHDFNNALTGIFGFAEMLKMQLEGNGRALADLDEIFRGAERASVLTRQLLTFARRQIVELVNLNLDAVIAELLKLVSKVVGEHIEIRTFLAKTLPTIRADVGQVEQVVMNLVLNARDAMPGGGQLLIETGLSHLDDEYVRFHPYMKAGAYVVLTVSDTGIGMDQKTQERVFEPFFTTKGAEKGTGLGLAMVYGIVKQHNGFIHLYSEPGKGTTFKIYLPPVEAAPDEIVRSEPPEIQGGTETVLLAEDDESVRMLAERTLMDLGYTVLAARNGEEAVEVFGENRDRIELAVLDVVMPRKGGKEAYEEMRKTRADLKVIFMSGYTANVVHESFILITGIPFIPKPFGPATLARKVREVLDGRVSR